MRAILVDDETLALDFLESQLKKINGIKVIEKFNRLNVYKSSQLVKKVDVAFLDIEMPEISGLELAEQLLEVNPNISIVFVTAYDEYAVQAFDLNALDYVLKPVTVDRLQKTIQRINLLKQQKENEEALDIGDKLYLYVCRELRFATTNSHPEVIHWRTSKVQELFLYLLHHRGETIHKSSLVELLWPNLEGERAYSQLYTAIYHIRLSLKQFNGHFSIKNTHEGYILLTKNVEIGIVEWERQITSVAPLNTDTIGVYEAIMTLYTGPYLDKHCYVWAEKERYRLEQLWIQIASEIAQFYYLNEKWEKAEDWYLKICETRPEEEHAHFSLMQLYDRLGYGVLVTHQYVQLEESLEDLGVKVSAPIQKWYEQWEQKSRFFS